MNCSLSISNTVCFWRNDGNENNTTDANFGGKRMRNTAVKGVA